MSEEDSPPYLEVNCKTSGQILRFAPGTEAGFAVTLINRKLKGKVPLATHIEAVKDGKEEETIAFGPNAILSNFGQNWKLQTVHSSEEQRNEHIQGMARQTSPRKHVSSVPRGESKVPDQINSVYIVKIVLAFILIFVLGAIFTLFLDNLPELIVFVKSIY
ncbi:unnamed protein product [Trifolium pratense]|uniref:Uncharacterized protein n=1 Tax=Trifolium pratense TaxID=57577 RepID=A0ACB0IYY2_TRIPR|nr:unnamed protein product [Trifolium pratense]